MDYTSIVKGTPVASREFGPGLVNRVERVRMSVDFATGEEWFDFPDAFENGQLSLLDQGESPAPASAAAPAAFAAKLAEQAPGSEDAAASAEPRKPGMSIKEFGQMKLAASRLKVGDVVRTKDNGVGKVVEADKDSFVVQFSVQRGWKRYRFPKDVNSGLVKKMDKR